MLSKLPVNSPIREYVYDILYHMPQEERFKLQGKYYNIGKTNSRAKHFCDTARLEELQHVLTLLGVEWYMVFFPKTFEGGTQKMFEGVVDEDSQLSTLRNIIKRKMFVTGGKQFALMLATMSESVFSGIYIKNLELQKFAYHYRKWSKGVGAGHSKQEWEKSTSFRYIAKSVFNSMYAFKKAKYLENDLFILIFLYVEHHAFVPYEKILDVTADIIEPRKVVPAVRRLLALNKIQKHPKKKSYTITTAGVLDVNKILEQVLLLNEATW